MWPKPPLAIRPLRSSNDSRRIGLVWRRGYPKAHELALLAELLRENPPEGTRPVPTPQQAGEARATLRHS